MRNRAFAEDALVPTARWGHTMCKISEGLALMVGGQGGGADLCRDSVWRFDSAGSKWLPAENPGQSTASLARMGAATFDIILTISPVFISVVSAPQTPCDLLCLAPRRIGC